MSVKESMRPLHVEMLGQKAFAPVFELQKQHHALVSQGKHPDTLFLVEHTPVITFGRRGNTGNVCASEQALERLGIDLVFTDRGGDVTYHGPGQMVGYPIVQMQKNERDVQGFVARLEQIMVRCASDFGLKAATNPHLRGVWVGNKKLGSVGVRISNWTSMHGFALNILPQTEGFDLIVPCGIQGCEMTSLQAETGKQISMEDVASRIVVHAGCVLNRQVVDHVHT